MTSMSLLVDDFTSAPLDLAVWEVVDDPGAISFQSPGRYTFITEEEVSATSSIRTLAGYDLTEAHLFLQLVDPGVQEANFLTFPILVAEDNTDVNNAIYAVIQNNSVQIAVVVGGVTTVVSTFAFVFADMEWWRIRETGGITYVETSPDVNGPWTIQASGASAIPITNLFVWAGINAAVPLATAKQVAIANLNFVPAPVVPFPNGALGEGLEAAFGADASGDPTLWTWTDLSGTVMDQTITVTRGRQDEASDVAPTTASMELDNPDGDLTPYRAQSPYYPYVDLGVPARWWIENLTPRLLIPPTFGACAQIASTSALNITSDLDIRIDVHMKTTDALGGIAAIVSRATIPTNYSWGLDMLPDRAIALSWSDTGAYPPDNVAISTVPVLPYSARTILRATLQANNGSGGWSVNFYIGETISSGPWTQIGPTVTGAPATSIFNTSDPLNVGSFPVTGGAPLPDADVYQFRLLNGIGGTPVAEADFTAQASGVISFVDSVGRLWTVYPAAMLTNRWYRIVGTVDEWDPLWPYGDLSDNQIGGLGSGEARTAIAISGVLRRLGQRSAPLDSPLRRSILASPLTRAYWPMEDGSGSTQFASAFPDGGPMSVAGDPSFANNSQLVGSAPLPTLSGTTFFSGPVTGTFANHWQVGWFFNMSLDSVVPGTTWSIMRVTTQGTVLTWEVRVNRTNIGVFGVDSTGTLVTSLSVPIASNFFDNLIYMTLQAMPVGGGNITWRLIYSIIAYPSAFNFGVTNTYAGTFGPPTAVGITPGAGLDGMVMGHLAVSDTFTPFTPMSSYPSAFGWQGETALERIVRLCSEENVSLRVIGEQSQTPLMGPQSVDTFLNLLGDARDVDAGILYERIDTVGLIYRTRTSFYNQPANIILDATNEELQNPFNPTRDDQRIRNIVTVQRDNGSSSTLQSDYSINQFGIYDESVTLNLFEDSQTLDAAAWILHQGNVDGLRYAQTTTDLGMAPQRIDDWLTCDVASRVTVTNLPPQHPSTDVTMVVEGYTEPISPVTWMPAINASPASIWDVAVLEGAWVPGPYLLRLDSDDSVLHAGVDAVITTLSVDILAGPAWVTDPTQFPFDINVGGERITVTAITAEIGNNQQFTVIRSINGVIKSHSAGDNVSLWYQTVLAR